MKKIFFLFLLVAIAGGHQFVTRTDEKIVQKQDSSMAANSLLQAERCALFQMSLESELDENQEIFSLVYSTQYDSCVYEKRTQSESGSLEKMEFINMETGEILTSWSYLYDNEKSFIDYKKEITNMR